MVPQEVRRDDDVDDDTTMEREMGIDDSDCDQENTPPQVDKGEDSDQGNTLPQDDKGEDSDQGNTPPQDNDEEDSDQENTPTQDDEDEDEDTENAPSKDDEDEDEDKENMPPPMMDDSDNEKDAPNSGCKSVCFISACNVHVSSVACDMEDFEGIDASQSAAPAGNVDVY